MTVECSKDSQFFVFCFFLPLCTAVEGEHHALSKHIDLAKAAIPEIAQKRKHTLLIGHRGNAWLRINKSAHRCDTAHLTHGLLLVFTHI